MSPAVARNVQSLERAYCVHSDILWFGTAFAGACQTFVDFVS
jgi:hypothetical protein